MKNAFKFDEDFIRNYDLDRDKGYILKVDVKYPKIQMNCIVIFRFQLKE